ncbi:hypothetical protein BC826DRAFT_996738 [Russula brevipes]|nr:hypothetical protein BC826DRAFT_996738 [Russula brevipes]
MADKCLSSNPDIAGIGTRINFYVWTLLFTLVLSARGSEDTAELLDELYKSSVIYGLSLVMAAVIQTLQGQLDLYHAIFVMHITFSSILCQRRFIQSRFSSADFRMTIFMTVQALSTVMFTVWLLYVMVKDSDFGSQPECNHLVRYVLVFIGVKATVTWLRVLFLIYLVLTSSMLLPGIHNKWRVVGQSPGQPEQEKPSERMTCRYMPVNFFSVIWAVYDVVTLELIVQRNRTNIQPGEDAWGFGQIIAVVLIVGTVIDLAVIYKRSTRRPEVTSSEELPLSNITV